MTALEPQRFLGGTVRITDSRDFPASTCLAAAPVELEPGVVREVHWRPNGDEWQYYLGSRAWTTVFASGATARTFDDRAGDVSYVPFAMGHYDENPGPMPLRFPEMSDSRRYADASLARWMALTPNEAVAANRNPDRALLDRMPAGMRPVAPA